PNPCVRCNDEVKFEWLLARARRLGAEALATGHYARVERARDGRYRLLRARDAAKDQSYFLHGLTQGELRFVRFPLGDLTKAGALRGRARCGEAARGRRNARGRGEDHVPGPGGALGLGPAGGWRELRGADPPPRQAARGGGRAAAWRRRRRTLARAGARDRAGTVRGLLSRRRGARRRADRRH